MLLILAVFVGLIGPVLNIFVNCFITCKIEVCKFSMIMCGFILKHFNIFSSGREKKKACRGCREKTEGGESKSKIVLA